MPVITLAWNAILYPGRFLTDGRVWAFSWPLIYGIGIVSWYLHVQYDSAIRRRFPSLKQTGRRIFFKALVNLVHWARDSARLGLARTSMAGTRFASTGVPSAVRMVS